METSAQNHIEKFTSTLLDSLDSGVKDAYIWFWELINNIISDNWVLTLSLVIITLVIATFLALAGNWALLGSTLYHLIYWSIMYIIILIFGAETIGSNWLSMVGSVILYPISYFLTGRILDKFRW